MQIAFLFLSALGFLDASFLTLQHYSRDPFSCPLFGGCGEVTSSIYSEFFGIPIALFGAGYYLVVFLLSLVAYLKNDKKALAIASQLTIAGFLASLYLVYIQVYVLGALCFYCMMSALSSTLLFIFGMVYLNKLNKFELKFIFDYLRKYSVSEKITGIARICLGFIFLWSFLSKTPIWFSGGLPAEGFLENGTSGVFADFFASGAGNPLVSLLFMFGMFSVGIALVLGITKRLATLGVCLMMGFIYLSALPPANNPLIDEHIIYSLLALILYFDKSAYEVFGLHRIWVSQSVVEKHKFLI